MISYYLCLFHLADVIKLDKSSHWEDQICCESFSLPADFRELPTFTLNIIKIDLIIFGP